MTTYSLRHNAKAAASRMVTQGTAPSTDFEIAPAEDGRFAIQWAERATVAPESEAAEDAKPALAKAEPQDTADEPGTAVTGAALRRGAGLVTVTALLRRPEGATIAEIQAATGWLPHTARAFISVSIKRKAGLAVITERVEDRGRVYRVAV
jgi:hypothetical protein